MWKFDDTGLTSVTVTSIKKCSFHLAKGEAECQGPWASSLFFCFLFLFQYAMIVGLIVIVEVAAGVLCFFYSAQVMYIIQRVRLRFR